MKKFNFLITLVFVISFAADAQIRVKSATDDHSYQFHEININAKEYVAKLAPLFASKSETAEIDVDIPLSISESVKLKVKPRQMLDDEFMETYPEITTYRIKPDPKQGYTNGRMTVSPYGIFVALEGPQGMIAIYPELNEDSGKHYIEIGTSPFANVMNNDHCQSEDHNHDETYGDVIVNSEGAKGPTGQVGAVLREYRFQAMTTGEFFQGNGNNGGKVSAVVTSSIQGIEMIYERDLGVNFIIRNPILRNDPFTDNLNPGGSRPSEAQREIENAVSINSFDIGHVLHQTNSGGSGVAGLGVVCNDGRKASGWSGMSNNTNSAWWGLFGHEVGHMFNAPHTFNAIGGACSTNISSSTSYEIASGTTIMSYNGAGCDNNIPSSGATDNYFHINSIDRMTGLVKNTSCAVEVDLGNTPPEVKANACGTFVEIPKGTPFRLVGEADDSDDDRLTYSWEQYDEDGGGTPTQGMVGNQAAVRTNTPLFRSYPPRTSPIRNFPKMQDIIDGVENPYEVLPQVARLLTFRLTARDNFEGGGGIGWDQVVLEVGNGGPLEVTFPNSGGSVVPVGVNTQFEWETNGSETYCENVDILLSLDGGNSFNVVIAEDVPYAPGVANAAINSGIANTEFARIMIRCSDSECVQFFDISDADFTINSNCKAKNTNICPSDGLVANSGDFPLELGLNNLEGVIASSFGAEITETSPTMPVVTMDPVGDCIADVVNPYESIEFQVTENGGYSFRINTNYDNSVQFAAIFDGDTFDSTSPCDSYLSSNGTTLSNGGFDVASFVYAELEACKTYVMTFHQSEDSTYVADIFNVVGPGSVLVNEAPGTDPELSYTYVAIDIEADTVVMVANDSDFRNLEAGRYRVVGVSYFVGSGNLAANPDDWVGLAISEIYSLGQCFSLSNNNMDLEVLSSCAADSIHILTQSECDNLKSIYDQTIEVFFDRSPKVGNIILNGMEFPIGPDADGIPPYSNIFTLEGLKADGESVDLLVRFSEDNTCFRDFPNIFAAPPNCCDIDIDLIESVEVCEGTPVTLTATVPNGNYSFRWFYNGRIVDNATTNTTSAPETGFYVVEVTNEFDCSKTDTAFVTQLRYPVLSFPQKNITICEGESTGITLANNARDSTFWYVNGVLLAEDDSSVNVTEAGEHIVVAYNHLGCESRDTMYAEIVPNVEPVTFENAFPIHLCPDQDTFLLATDNEDYTYEWQHNPAGSNVFFTIEGFDPPNIMPSTGYFANLFGTLGGGYYVTVTNENGCSSRGNIGVVYHLFPVMTELTASPLEFCEGDQAVLDAEGNVFNFVWKRSGDVLDTIVGVDTYVVTTGGLYSVYGYDNYCESNSLNITLTSNPVPDLSGKDEYFPCEGDDIIIEVLSDGNYEYSWIKDGDIIPGETTTTLDATSLGQGAYSLVAVTDKGCDTRFDLYVDVIENPMVEFNAPPELLCTGEVLDLSVTTNLLDVLWEYEGTLMTDPDVLASGSVYNLKITQGGTYTAVGINNEGCEVRASHTVTEDAVPFVDGGPDIVSCSDDGVRLTFETDEPNPGDYQYIWTLNGTTFFPINPFTPSPNFDDVTLPGEYAIVVRSPSGCEAYDTVNVQIGASPMLNLVTDFENLCGDTPVIITAQAGAGDLQWYKDGVLIPGETGLTLEVTEVGEYNAEITIDADCSATSDIIEIRQFEQPEITFSDLEEQCFGREILIDLMPNADNFVYEWTIDGMIDLNQTESTLLIRDNTPPGTYNYSVVVTDGTCTATGSFFVEIISSPTVAINVDNNSFCIGDEVTLTAVSSLTQIRWQKDGATIPGETGLSLTVSEGGTYTAIAPSGGVCDGIDSVVLTAIDSPEIMGNQNSYAACVGESILIELAAAGTYPYEWEINGTVDPQYTDMKDVELNLPAGSYTVIVTAGTGECTDVLEFDVEFANPPAVDLIVPANSICNGDEMILTALTNETNIMWSRNGTVIPGVSGTTLAITQGGTYGIIVTNSACTTELDTLITSNDPPMLSTNQSTYEECEGRAISLELNTNGNYEYVWTVNGTVDNNLTGEIIEFNYPAGIYEVVATASVGNCSDTETFNVTILEALSLQITSPLTEICEGETVTLTANTMSTNITWEKDGIEIPGANSSTLQVTETGLYAAFVSAGADCDATDQIMINVYPEPIMAIGSTFSGCADAPFEMDVMPDGNYTYTWKIDNAPQANLTGSVITIDQPIGSYIYEVTATIGTCQVIQTVLVSVVSTPSIMLMTGGVSNICTGQELDITANTNLSTVEWQLDGVIIPGESGKVLTITQGGVYTAVVSAGENCEAMASVTIDEGDGPVYTLQDEYSGCEGEAITIDVMPAGTYTYQWSVDGVINASSQGPTLTLNNQEGTYLVELEISNGGCVILETTTVSVISTPTMSLSSSVNSICSGEEVELTASTNLAEIMWEKDGVLIPGETGSTLTISEGGVYTASVSGGANCDASDMITIGQFDTPMIDLPDSDSGCFMQPLEIAVNGSDDYDYSWEVNGVGDPTLSGRVITVTPAIGSYTYTVTARNGDCSATASITIEITDAPFVDLTVVNTEICEGETTMINANTNLNSLVWEKDGVVIPGETGSVLIVSEGGIYTAIASAGTSCDDMESVTITSFEQPEVSVDNDVINGCTGDNLSIDINANGNYTYRWELDGVEIPGATGSSLPLTESGIYTCIVGGGSCSVSLTITVNLQMSDMITLPDDLEFCEGESYVIFATTASQNITWYLNNVEIPNTVGNQLDVSTTGVYTAETTSSNGCQAQDDMMITFTPNPMPELGPEVQNICEGDNLTLSVDPSMGSIEWFLDGQLISTDASIDVTAAGMYLVEVTAGADCKGTDQVNVSIGTSLDVNLDGDKSICDGEPLTLTSSIMGDSYDWTLNGVQISTTESAIISTEGILMLTVTSSSGCSGSDQVNVVSNPKPTATVNNSEVCPGESVMITTNESFESYQWSNGANTETASYTHNNLNSTDLISPATVTVTDSNGCTTVANFTVNSVGVVNAVVESENYSICFGEEVELIVSGGDTYEWTGVGLSATDIPNPIASPASTTIYEVRVSKGSCPSNFEIVSIELEVAAEVETEIVALDTCVYKGLDTDLEAVGGRQYEWEPAEFIVGSNLAAVPTINVESNTTFMVTITDQYGCTYMHEIDVCVIDDAEEVITPVTIISPNGDNMNDVLYIEGLEDFPENEITIFNRWGNIVYEAKGYQFGGKVWDGTRNGVELPADTYYYILRFGSFTVKKPITLVKE